MGVLGEKRIHGVDGEAAPLVLGSVQTLAGVSFKAGQQPLNEFAAGSLNSEIDDDFFF